jgi:hypothetical protein
MNVAPGNRSPLHCASISPVSCSPPTTSTCRAPGARRVRPRPATALRCDGVILNSSARSSSNRQSDSESIGSRSSGNSSTDLPTSSGMYSDCTVASNEIGPLTIEPTTRSRWSSPSTAKR